MKLREDLVAVFVCDEWDRPIVSDFDQWEYVLIPEKAWKHHSILQNGECSTAQKQEVDLSGLEIFSVSKKFVYAADYIFTEFSEAGWPIAIVDLDPSEEIPDTFRSERFEEISEEVQFNLSRDEQWNAAVATGFRKEVKRGRSKTTHFTSSRRGTASSSVEEEADTISYYWLSDGSWVAQGPIGEDGPMPRVLRPFSDLFEIALRKAWIEANPARVLSSISKRNIKRVHGFPGYGN